MTTSKVYVRDSLIHGKGLFAAEAISSGEVVVEWKKQEITHQKYDALTPKELTYTSIEGGKVFLMGEPERYVNHSCSPNTIPGLNCDIASSDIKKDEEITADYSNFYIPDGQFQCICGKENCRGTVFGNNSN